jgi:hypothetical protein
MNQLDMLTTLMDAAAQMPETRHLKAALKQAEKKLVVLRAQKIRRNGSFYIRKAVASCIECGQILASCHCWDSERGVWLHAPKEMTGLMVTIINLSPGGTNRN